MASPDSDNEPVAGAVFGFTGSVDKEELEESRKARAKSIELKKPPGARTALKSRAGGNSRRKRREKRQRGLPKELQVKEDDVDQLGALHSLLLTFNDPYAPGMDLASHIQDIPVLEGRLIRTARITTGHMDLRDVNVALSLLGNKALEKELLVLLEDLTEVKADLIDKANKRK